MCVFNPFSIAIIESWSAFVWFARVGLCVFPRPVGVRDWLRIVIVTFSRLFFLTFLAYTIDSLYLDFASRITAFLEVKVWSMF